MFALSQATPYNNELASEGFDTPDLQAACALLDDIH
jgi:hypothetical protein